MDRIRTDVWDFVFKSGPQTVQQIADQLQLAVSTVNSVIEHEWFSKSGETVTIATSELRSAES